MGGQEACGGAVRVFDAGGLLRGLDGLGPGDAGQDESERSGGSDDGGGQAVHLVPHFLLMPSISAP